MKDQKFTQPVPSALPDKNLSTSAIHDASGVRLLHRVFFGDEGLRAGWGILLFVLLCVGSNYAFSMLHLFPSQPAPPLPRCFRQ